MTGQGIFITGTDTGVGKTLVACALLHAYAARGLRAVGMKPVAAGAEMHEGRLVNEDVAALQSAANVAAPLEVVNPYCFAPPIAPHIAAAEAGVTIDIGLLYAAYERLAALAERVVVEGAGGFRVPLGEGVDTADLAVRLRLPVLLVVGLRLGCINHALLTAAAVRAVGLPLAGWVANHLDPDMLHVEDNVATLVSRLGAPLIGRFSHTPHPDPLLAARTLDLDPLR